MKYKIIFMDLDGTLIETASGKTFPETVLDFKMKEEVIDKLAFLYKETEEQNDDLPWICIVTNQGGVELGYQTSEAMRQKIGLIVLGMREMINMRLGKSITDYKTVKVTWNMCTSNDKNNNDRKPNTGMLKNHCYFIEKIDKSYSKEEMLMVGDASGLPGQFSDSDKKCAENFGIDYMDVQEFVNNDISVFL